MRVSPDHCNDNQGDGSPDGDVFIQEHQKSRCRECVSSKMGAKLQRRPENGQKRDGSGQRGPQASLRRKATKAANRNKSPDRVALKRRLQSHHQNQKTTMPKVKQPFMINKGLTSCPKT